LPKESLSIEGLPVQGSAEAPYAIVVFSEFQCPYCGKFVRETYPSLKSEFVDTGLVQFAFRHLPLSIHPLARGAAAGAICAGYQGRFWEMHDLLFGVPLQLDPPVLRLRAHELGLNEREFLSCIAEPKREIEADLLLARNLGVSSTPTFLVGSVSGKAVKVSKVLAGARSLPDFRIALDELRKASRPRG
jgi:protein-disulfide isomerase